MAVEIQITDTIFVRGVQFYGKGKHDRDSLNAQCGVVFDGTCFSFLVIFSDQIEARRRGSRSVRCLLGSL